MQETKVKFPNRYGDDVCLEKIDDYKYKLVHHSPFTRVGIIEGKERSYNFVDVSGGPMISVGDELSIGEVESISMSEGSYIIEVET